MTRVKICGITSFEEALCAADAGADYLGFNFFRKSPRYVTAAAAGEIISKLVGQISASAPRSATDTGSRPLPLFIGIFVNEQLAVVEETIQRAHLGLRAIAWRRAACHAGGAPRARLQSAAAH